MSSYIGARADCLVVSATPFLEITCGNEEGEIQVRMSLQKAEDFASSLEELIGFARCKSALIQSLRMRGMKEEEIAALCREVEIITRSRERIDEEAKRQGIDQNTGEVIELFQPAEKGEGGGGGTDNKTQPPE